MKGSESSKKRFGAVKATKRASNNSGCTSRDLG